MQIHNVNIQNDRLYRPYISQQSPKSLPLNRYLEYTGNAPVTIRPFIKPYILSFGAETEKSIEDRVKSVKGHKHYGAGLFNEHGYIDFSKVGWEYLKTEPIDWAKASKDEAMAMWHAAALAETYTNPWVKKFNYMNVSVPLSTYHTLYSTPTKERYHESLKELEHDIYNPDKIKGFTKEFHETVLKDLNPSTHENALEKISKSQEKFLDEPIIKPGTDELNLDFVVFDTETTGVNVDHENNRHYRPDKPAAKIVQLGAVKIRNGRIDESSVLNQLVNPETEIEEGAQKIHGITNEMVKNAPTMKEIFSGKFKRKEISQENKDLLKKGFANYIGNMPIVAYNANFDVPLLNSEARMAGQDEKNEVKYPYTLDPFILIQRIHPFVGASKKLTEQYRSFFGRDVEGAHDALVDVKATVDMLKYTALYLNDHYKPKGKSKKEHPHLTVRDVLMFQFGENIEGLDIKLHKNYRFDKKKRFDKSYRLYPIAVSKFPGEYEFDPRPGKKPKDKRNNEIKSILRNEIGEHNLNQLAECCATGGIKYKKDNLHKFLYGSGATGRDGYKDTGVPFETYKGLAPDQLKERVEYVIKSTIDNDYVTIWMKNVSPESIQEGNDLPDINIVKKVMSQSKSTLGKKSKTL